MGTEFELLRRLRPLLARRGGRVVVPPGDDAAAVRLRDSLACVTVDVLVEGIHFRRETSSNADVGWKAIAVNCSDVAAMGARPAAAVVGLARPTSWSEEDVVGLYEGMRDACAHWGVDLVGGDLVVAQQLVLSVTMLGDHDGRLVERRGARPGDAVVVVGSLGASAAALACLARGVQPDEAHLTAHRRPRALVAAGVALAAKGATAMVDVSDGLGADLGHVAAASEVTLRLDAAALPIAPGVRETAAALGVDLLELACGGGEDFALAASVPREAADTAVAAAAAADGVVAAVVGTVVAGDGGVVLVDDGRELDITRLGYDHYRSLAS